MDLVHADWAARTNHKFPRERDYAMRQKILAEFAKDMRREHPNTPLHVPFLDKFASQVFMIKANGEKRLIGSAPFGGFGLRLSSKL